MFRVGVSLLVFRVGIRLSVFRVRVDLLVFRGGSGLVSVQSRNSSC